MLNTLLGIRQRQILNGYFSVNNGKFFSLIFNCIGQLTIQKTVHLGSDKKRLCLDGENWFFHINLMLLNLRYPQFATEDNFLKLVLWTSKNIFDLAYF